MHFIDSELDISIEINKKILTNTIIKTAIFNKVSNKKH